MCGREDGTLILLRNMFSWQQYLETMERNKVTALRLSPQSVVFDLAMFKQFNILALIKTYNSSTNWTPWTTVTTSTS